MTAVFHFLEVLVMSVAALVALTVVLIVVIAYLPGSPLKEILALFAKRIAVTAAMGLIAVPLEPIPGIDVVYDVAGLIFLVTHWFGIVKAIRDVLRSAPRSADAVAATAASAVPRRRMPWRPLPRRA